MEVGTPRGRHSERMKFRLTVSQGDGGGSREDSGDRSVSRKESARVGADASPLVNSLQAG